MKVGDLVQHNPAKSTASSVKRIYADWGHEPDFKSGIVLAVRDNFAKVMPSKPTPKPAWYQWEELEILSESTKNYLCK